MGSVNVSKTYEGIEEVAEEVVRAGIIRRMEQMISDLRNLDVTQLDLHDNKIEDTNADIYILTKIIECKIIFIIHEYP